MKQPNWIDTLPPEQFIPLPSNPADLTAEHVKAVVQDPTALDEFIREVWKHMECRTVIHVQISARRQVWTWRRRRRLPL